MIWHISNGKWKNSLDYYSSVGRVKAFTTTQTIAGESNNDLKWANITLAPEFYKPANIYTYKGTKRPKPHVVFDSLVLTEGVDYKISYEQDQIVVPK